MRKCVSLFSPTERDNEAIISYYSKGVDVFNMALLMQLIKFIRDVNSMVVVCVYVHKYMYWRYYGNKI